MTLRPISKVVRGQKMMEGAGVQICRTIGTNDIRVDPYLMLDELKMPSEQATMGFPDHPVRGLPCLVSSTAHMHCSSAPKLYSKTE